MRVLVTGASGFLGTALCQRLGAAGHAVTGVSSRDCDLTAAESLNALNGDRYDQIFHLAAWTQAGDFCLYHSGEQWVINQKINTNALDWWQRSQPQAKFVTMGSSCSYPPDRPLIEANYMVGEPIVILYTYAMTKRMLYAGLRALHRQYGLRYLCLVPSTLYGPGYHTDARQLHFIFDLIRKILRGATYDERVVLWGDGWQRRELIYIDDFVDIALRLSQSVDDDLINVGAGEQHSIREFAQLICEEVGYEFSKIAFDESRYVGARSKCLDTTKLRELMPDMKLTSLVVGLRTTIDWSRHHLLEPAT